MTLPRGFPALLKGMQAMVMLAALVIAFAMTGPAEARDLTAAERAALDQTLLDFQKAITGRQMEQVLAVVPPRIMEHIAKQSSLDTATVRKGVIDKMSEAFANVSIRSFKMDMATADFRQLPSGTPYVLIPTELTMEVNAKAVEAKSQTLAIIDDSAWYLLDLSAKPQVSIFTQVYPEFAGVEFGGKTMKAVP
ncbi:hypothetical protein [Microvirga solisilvae]|uniref:hypothetical protein n=1 Tax=Microvirga solisilvae TaxID=2919498 RepID=UPI001FAF99A9|nr:hypothetical protein [Microvirga solisilvae]